MVNRLAFEANGSCVHGRTAGVSIGQPAGAPGEKQLEIDDLGGVGGIGFGPHPGEAHGSRYVTAHLAEAVGLEARSMLTGEELAKLRDEALGISLRALNLFVELGPQQKERIVRALQRTGHSVRNLGNGINDAPTLHAADVGEATFQTAWFVISSD